MSENKIKLADAGGYYDRLNEEGLAEEKQNKGYVWTMQINGTSTISVLGLANVDYTLRLNCSHVGETPYGVYRGEMYFKFNGDIGGAKAVLALIGLSGSEDLEGWFRNDRFVMKLKPYDETDETEFIGTFNAEDEDSQARNAVAEALLGSIIRTAEKDQRKASGIWYDWDFHMTEGDMGTYMKINGGLFFYFVNGYAKTDASGKNEDVDLTGKVIFHPAFVERYNEPIDTPFPYTLKMYEDHSVVFTLYNAKGGPVTVSWKGKIDSVPVENTVTVNG